MNERDWDRNIAKAATQLVPQVKPAMTTLAEAEAFIVLVRKMGMNEDTAIDVITELKKSSLVITYA